MDNESKQQINLLKPIKILTGAFACAFPESGGRNSDGALGAIFLSEGRSIGLPIGFLTSCENFARLAGSC